ncbi:hypothetical protein [Rhizobium herbae]
MSEGEINKTNPAITLALIAAFVGIVAPSITVFGPDISHAIRGDTVPKADLEQALAKIEKLEQTAAEKSPMLPNAATKEGGSTGVAQLPQSQLKTFQTDGGFQNDGFESDFSDAENVIPQKEPRPLGSLLNKSSVSIAIGQKTPIMEGRYTLTVKSIRNEVAYIQFKNVKGILKNDSVSDGSLISLHPTQTIDCDLSVIRVELGQVLFSTACWGASYE